ncbi:hypothetical protein M406DRAFT_25021, partial [Cryphonectria parasitica EP155]
SARSEGSLSLVSAQGRKVNALRPDVQICLKHHYKSKTYTSGSVLEGEVTITTQRDTPFDSIDIVLVGCSKTRTEGYSSPHESTHTFLKLRMPVSEERYPTSRILESGATLTVPFTFVLPDFLTLSACHHKVDSEHIRDHHLCLPPSMGSWARGNWEKDDFAPHMAEVIYAIKARVWREQLPASASSAPRARHVRIIEAVKAIQVLPSSPEAAPLSVTAKDCLYKMTKTKTLRKNLMSSKTGRLTVSGQQPRAIMLLPDGRVSSGTTAQIDLKFEPATAGAGPGDVQPPPKITGVSAKIAAHTYYSASAISSLPNMGEWMRVALSDRRGLYSSSVALPATARPAHIGPWHMHHTRRDSGYGSDSAHNTAASCSTATTFHAPPVHHTATIQLPVPDLPTTRKAFVPSFHGCILSRVYTLHLSVRVETGGAAGGTSTLSLDLPVQIGVEPAAGSPGAEEALPSWEDALEDAAVDEFLRPRVMGVPQEAFQETSVLPGY